MNSAMPIATGTAMTIARTELSTVPNARAAMPKTWLPFGSQASSEKKWPLFACRAGTASLIEEDRDGRHDPQQDDAGAGGGVTEGPFTMAAPRGGPARGRSAVTGTNVGRHRLLGDRLDGGADLGQQIGRQRGVAQVLVSAAWPSSLAV